MWQHTLSLLAAADSAGDGTTIELGYERPILRWLGCDDEAQCREIHGLTVREALAGDRGNLACAARIVDGDRDVATYPQKESLAFLVKVWAERAGRLAGSGHDSESIASMDRAVSLGVLSEEMIRSLWSHFIEACQVYGNQRLARMAHQRL